MSTEPIRHRFGTVAIVGRPNVGKSTLLNHLIGANLSITSRKAQTTRHRILGIRNGPDHQIQFIDTPGIQHAHQAALNRQLNRAAAGALGDADLVVWVLEIPKLTAEDDAVLRLIPASVPVLVALNKADLMSNERDRAKAFEMAAQLSHKRSFEALVPISAEKGFQLEVLVQEIVRRLPEGEKVYEEDRYTDRSSRFLTSEIIREKLFRLTGDEIPYEATVVIDQFQEEISPVPGKPDSVAIDATVVVARATQKPIVIGQGGERIRRIGTEARQDLEALLGAKVMLRLWVKVKDNWADDDAAVRSFGYD